MMVSEKTLALILAFIFFVVGVSTLPKYGINWDTINHLPRGQAYLHYFLTGKKDFSDLPEWRWYWQKPNSLFIDADIPESEVPKRSLYQSDATPFTWFMEHDGRGHPPLSDILSSAFNIILFQKLRLINDIDAYRVYGVFLAAALVGLVFWWASSVYGKFAGLISALSLSLYPLFWSESHFNTEKDIPETVFWGFLLFSVWRGITKKDLKWILASGIFFGLALGTKFNVLFSVFIILPWLAVFLGHQYFKHKPSIKKAIRKNLKLVLTTMAVLFIGLGIFVASWPYLWPDPLARIGKVTGFYKSIGLTESIDSRFLGSFNTNTYPLQWIAYTTPLIIFGLLLLGSIIAIYRLRQEEDKVSLLFLLWLVVPIARVTWPGTTIYGGARQIMEFIPALTILAGLGGLTLRDWLATSLSKINLPKGITRSSIASVLVLATFIPITAKLIQIHPNENVYFNPLIGGLAGAKERDFPAWGFSLGAPYRQGAGWLNRNAEEGANVVYAFELIPNIPRLWLRRDLNLHNSNRSGYLRRGEYAITLTYQGTTERSYYDVYLEKFIEPVYKVEVDGVSILKIWKNDEEHLKVRWKEEEDKEVLLQEKDFGLRLSLGEARSLSRLELSYDERGCRPLSSGYVQISKDGEMWQRLPGIFPRDWLIPVLGQQPKDGSFIEPFVGQEARFIDLVIFPKDTCLKNIEEFRVYYLL